MFDWFERINFNTTEAVLVVTTGWKERCIHEAKIREIPLIVIESPFDFFKIGPVKRFFDMCDLLRNYNPSGFVFFQAHFEEFGLPELIPAYWKSGGNVFMHENLGCPKPPECTSKKYFGIFPGMGLWWQYYMFCIRSRSYLVKYILVVSQEIKMRYVSWWGYPANKVLVTYHGVDSKEFLPDSNMKMMMRKKFNIPENDIVLINLARFAQVKRLDRAINAFNKIYQKTPNSHLVLVGSGPLEQQLRKLAENLPCCGHIHFTGQVSNPSDYLKMADIFILSSDNEGLSIALMEAMVCGLIAVSTDCTGSNEIIAEGRTGFIVDKSEEGVSEGMLKVLSLSALEQEAMRQSSMQFVQEQFDIDSNVQKVFKTMGINYLNASSDHHFSYQ